MILFSVCSFYVSFMFIFFVIHLATTWPVLVSDNKAKLIYPRSIILLLHKTHKLQRAP